MQTLAQSRKELESANVALARMKEVYASPPIDVEEYEKAWFDYLGAIERVWNKCESQVKTHPSWHSWSGQWKTLRTKDPLLSFLSKSRGAREHSHLKVVGRGFGIRSVTKTHGPTDYTPGDNGTPVVRIAGGESFTIKLDPEIVQLKAITYRGHVYDVPKLHQGRKVRADPIEMAELGIAFYTALIDEAERYFCAEPDKD